MLRVLFLRNNNVHSEETFIDTNVFDDNPEQLNKAVLDAGKYIAERHNLGELWTAEILQVVFKLTRTGGAENVKSDSGETKKD